VAALNELEIREKERQVRGRRLKEPSKAELLAAGGAF